MSKIPTYPKQRTLNGYSLSLMHLEIIRIPGSLNPQEAALRYKIISSFQSLLKFSVVGPDGLLLCVVSVFLRRVSSFFHWLLCLFSFDQLAERKRRNIRKKIVESTCSIGFSRSRQAWATKSPVRLEPPVLSTPFPRTQNKYAYKCSFRWRLSSLRESWDVESTHPR